LNLIIILSASSRSISWLSIFAIAAIYLLPDFYIARALQTASGFFFLRVRKIYRIINYSALAAGVVALLAFSYLGDGAQRINLYLNGIFIAVMFFKLLTAIILFAEDIFRLFTFSIKVISSKLLKPEKKRISIPRRKFISQSALLIGAVPFTGILYGMIKGKYDFKISKQAIYFDNLPPAFSGITITHISDIHIGSFDLFAKDIIRRTVETINTLKSDMLFFTGDIVNSRANEMDGWHEIFKQLDAPLGKYSVLGNHDYGDYVEWENEEEKIENLRQIINIHPQLGFKLLLNENISLERNDDRIFIAGVENWGNPPFPQLGDLKKATSNLNENDFKILLSHDPSHWEAQILKEEHPCQLTCSGHTHGFQMGIEIPGFKWSFSQYFYKQWAGLYNSGNHHLYVNRGFGFVGFSGRCGIRPEITQLTLLRK
jgi:predicted MPP superfamily phosphohydrolase